MQLAQRLRRLFTSPAITFDDDVELMKAVLHPDAHEEGGLACNDKQLLAEMRECIMQWIKSMGRQILKGDLNLVNSSFPVLMFEPRSYLQKLADIWAYPDYINAAAAQQDDPLQRMKLLVTWLVAGLHHSLEAWRKPFNPILGETWQATMPGGLQLFMEQISHHPPVSAYQLDGPNGAWTLHGWSQPAVVPVVKFYGIKTVAKGQRQIDFADGSTVHMSMPHFAIKGVVYAAKPHAEVLGVARLLDSQHHLEAVVNFGPVLGTRQRMLARADAVCGEIYQLPRSPHLQAALGGAHHAGGALQRSSTSAVPLQDLEDAQQLPTPSDGSSEQGPDSDDEAIFKDFHATHLTPAAAAAAAASGSANGAASSGGRGKPPIGAAVAAALRARRQQEQGQHTAALQQQRPPGSAHHRQQQQQHQHQHQGAGAPAGAASSRKSAPGGVLQGGGSGAEGGRHLGVCDEYVHRSRSATLRTSSTPGHRRDASSEGGGVGGSGLVPGVAVARIEGCWLSHLNIDNQRYWTLNEATSQRWVPAPAPLPSDLRFRQDLAALAGGDQAAAQHWKEVLEQQQRSDRKLREEAGVYEH